MLVKTSEITMQKIEVAAYSYGGKSVNEVKSNNIKALLKRFRYGEKAALEDLMLLVYKDLYLLSYSYLKDKMLAEDVVSETFIKLIEKIHTVNTEQNLNGYLHTIVINKSLDIIRKRKREIYLEDSGLYRTSSNQSNNTANVKDALSSLNSNEREVMLLWNFNYTLNEISAKTGFTINQVRLLLKKAKENFSIEYNKNDIG